MLHAPLTRKHPRSNKGVPLLLPCQSGPNKSHVLVVIGSHAFAAALAHCTEAVKAKLEVHDSVSACVNEFLQRSFQLRRRATSRSRSSGGRRIGNAGPWWAFVPIQSTLQFLSPSSGCRRVRPSNRYEQADRASRNNTNNSIFFGR